jgi:formylglycine-generating enzyme required for sulfatase activity
MLRLAGVSMRDALLIAAFMAGSSLSIAIVVRKARRDSADPARCAALMSMGNRCCAAGQRLEEGRCVGRPARCPWPLAVTDLGCVASPARVAIAGGRLRAGAGDWEAEGRVRPREADVRPFEIDAFEITEGDYARCVEAGRCAPLPLTGEPGRALGGMARSDVENYCAFRGGRLPAEDEWTFAAAGSNARRYPWGETGAVCRRGAWGLKEGPCGFGFRGPELTGAHPDGASPEGVHDLAGNVAEWVIGRPEDGIGLVRGGSFVTSLATDLRTWHAEKVPPATRSAEIGGRCVHEPEADAGGRRESTAASPAPWPSSSVVPLSAP